MKLNKSKYICTFAYKNIVLSMIGYIGKTCLKFTYNTGNSITFYRVTYTHNIF